MRWLFLMFGLQVTLAAADDRDAVKGFWASEGSIFVIFEEADLLHARIIALKNPVYRVDEQPDRAGQVRLDDNNPDPALRKRPIIGLQMFDGHQYEDSRWRGEIYDPESGNTYQSRLKLTRDGRLEIRGYIGVPLFGRSAQFDSADTCLPHIVAMLQMTEHRDLCASE